MEEFYKKQPTINFGTLGHVSNGKTTLVSKITNTDTRRYSKEQETNKTIRLGYANAMIYKCSECPSPQSYQSGPSTEEDVPCKLCGHIMELKKHISFVDSPGHNLLMATMLNGASIMDEAFLITSANNKSLPAPQTAEHMIAAEVMDLNVCICYNKVDLVKRSDAELKLTQLKNFTKGTKYENAPIIPMSANFEANVDIVCQYIAECVQEPVRDLDSDAELIAVRSFNTNKQHVSIEELQGGVVGGSLIKGKLCPGDEVTVVPGFVVKNSQNDLSTYVYQPIKTQIVEICSEKTQLDVAIPGGLIAVKLTIDPYFTSQDKLIGNMILAGDISRYKVFEKFTIKYNIIKSLSEISEENYSDVNVNDVLIINCNAKNTNCKVVSMLKKKKIMELESLTDPICVQIKGKITLSKKSQSSGPRLVGCGYVESGKESLMI